VVERGCVRPPVAAMERRCAAMFWLGRTGIVGSVFT